MRQAGRYMPEYRAVRDKVPFLELCKTPDLAAQVTVEAVERLGVDAAIIFADILLILEPMGVGLEFAPGDGPIIHRPVRSGADVDRLEDRPPSETVAFVFEAVRKVRAALADDIALIGLSALVGFCGVNFQQIPVHQLRPVFEHMPICSHQTAPCSRLHGFPNLLQDGLWQVRFQYALAPTGDCG